MTNILSAKIATYAVASYLSSTFTIYSLLNDFRCPSAIFNHKHFKDTCTSKLGEIDQNGFLITSMQNSIDAVVKNYINDLEMVQNGINDGVSLVLLPFKMGELSLYVLGQNIIESYQACYHDENPLITPPSLIQELA